MQICEGNSFHVLQVTVQMCCVSFLGVFAELQYMMISFVMSVHLHGITQVPLDIFSLNLTLWCFLKICGASTSLIPDRNNRYFT